MMHAIRRLYVWIPIFISIFILSSFYVHFLRSPMITTVKVPFSGFDPLPPIARDDEMTTPTVPTTTSQAPGTEKHVRDYFDLTLSTQVVELGPENTGDGTRYLIYRCDASTMQLCGGWADRVKGILSGYLIANLTGRVFKVEILSPKCDLRRVVAPNRVNWSLPVSFHEVVKEGDDVHIMNLIDNVGFHRKVHSVDFETLPSMSAKYVYYKCNLDFMMELKKSERYERELSWMRNLTRDQINAVVFKHLFKPPVEIRDKLSRYLSANLQPQDTLLCAHIRTGRNPSIPNDSERRVKEEHLSSIWSLLRNVSSGVGSFKLFLMSDSDEVIEEAKSHPFGHNVITTEGRVVHVEKSRGISVEEICDGFERVAFEQYILMHCDVLVISKSGLGRMASYVRASDQGLYCVLLDGHVVPCQKSKLQEVYHIYG